MPRQVGSRTDWHHSPTQDKLGSHCLLNQNLPQRCFGRRSSLHWWSGKDCKTSRCCHNLTFFFWQLSKCLRVSKTDINYKRKPTGICFLKFHIKKSHDRRRNMCEASYYNFFASFPFFILSSFRDLSANQNISNIKKNLCMPLSQKYFHFVLANRVWNILFDICLFCVGLE